MVQRSPPQQTLADRYFPIRVRIAVPPVGLGAQLNRMLAWLDEHAGPDGYFCGAQTTVGLVDAALFYFLEARVAAAFVDTFGCALVVGHEPPASRDALRSPR